MGKLRFSGLVGAVAFAVVCAASPASSQTAPPGTPTASADALQAAKDLVGLVSGSMLADIANRMTAQVWPPVETALRTQNPKIDAATLAELRGEFTQQVITGVADAMQGAPAIYARYFTVQEMRDLAAFYRTPIGAKTLRVMPQLMTDINGLILPRMQGLQERVNLAFLNILQRRGLYAQ
jgi:hypothetical protein